MKLGAGNDSFTDLLFKEYFTLHVTSRKMNFPPVKLPRTSTHFVSNILPKCSNYIFRLDQAIKMSWDSYIDNLIAQSKDTNGTAHLDKACIIGLDGGASWTTAGHAAVSIAVLLFSP